MNCHFRWNASQWCSGTGFLPVLCHMLSLIADDEPCIMQSQHLVRQNAKIWGTQLMVEPSYLKISSCLDAPCDLRWPQSWNKVENKELPYGVR
jgi:hypothetical protein